MALLALNRDPGINAAASPDFYHLAHFSRVCGLANQAMIDGLAALF